MAEKEGWIKTYRKIQDCWIWLDKEPFDKRSAWIDLLLTANHADKKLLLNGKLIIIGRGQILTSIRILAEKWKWSYDKTLRFLKLIESDGMIQRDSDNFRTLITIENYEVYQDLTITNRTPISEQTSKQLSEQVSKQSVHEQVTNKNVKNDKNNNICSNSLSDIEPESDEEKKRKAEQKKREEDTLRKNFEIIYKSYPKKVGKTKGFELYKGWLKGRDILGEKIKLTNKQMWSAIARYKEQLEANGTEKQYIKQFDTFMNKPILDYIGDDE